MQKVLDNKDIKICVSEKYIFDKITYFSDGTVVIKLKTAPVEVPQK